MPQFDVNIFLTSFCTMFIYCIAFFFIVVFYMFPLLSKVFYVRKFKHMRQRIILIVYFRKLLKKYTFKNYYLVRFFKFFNN